MSGLTRRERDLKIATADLVDELQGSAPPEGTPPLRSLCPRPAA